MNKQWRVTGTYFVTRLFSPLTPLNKICLVKHKKALSQSRHFLPMVRCNAHNSMLPSPPPSSTKWNASKISHHVSIISTLIQCDSFGTRPKKMWIFQRLFIRFWTCIYDYIPCFMRSMLIPVCRSVTSRCHRDNDWRPAPCRAQPCYCVVR